MGQLLLYRMVEHVVRAAQVLYREHGSDEALLVLLCHLRVELDLLERDGAATGLPQSHRFLFELNGPFHRFTPLGL